MTDHIDPELQARAKNILSKLKLLGEASSGGIVTIAGKQAADSKAPPESRPERASHQPPPKDRSLYDWYVWQFARATSDHRYRLLCYLAERDYERYRRRPDDSRRGPISLRGKDGGSGEVESMRRIVAWYEGLDALEVAILEECSIGHVKKARRVHRRNEEDGRERNGWEGWDEERRVIEIRQRRAKGWGQKKVADDIGVAKRTVQRYWAHAEVPAGYSGPPKNHRLDDGTPLAIVPDVG